MSRKLKFAIALASGLLAAGSTQAMAASAAMKDADGKSLGTLELSEKGGKGVKISGALSGLKAGEHAFHIHETGKCEPPFKSAGGHFNPGDKKHGKVEGGSHAGDMPNITVGKNGKVKIGQSDAKVTLKKGEKNSVFDDDGSAIVIHAKADDYKSQPSGDAGDRVACGVIK